MSDAAGHSSRDQSRRAVSLELMDAGLAFAPRLRAEVMRTVEDCARFSLPVWLDDHGQLRIALPMADPEHGADHLQLVAPLGEVLEAIGQAVREQADRDQAAGGLA